MATVKQATIEKERKDELRCMEKGIDGRRKKIYILRTYTYYACIVRVRTDRSKGGKLLILTSGR